MLEVGTVINERYRIIGPLGEGGMGTVYEAEHTGVGRRVAVKVLLPEFAKNPEINGRFAREARAAAAIGHDNIIDVLDVGLHDGLPYMVMELLKGESLASRLEREKNLSPEAASYVMAQVLSALGSAHAAGIIHRDLKPDNVFLTTKAGVRDFVKLLDFGISKFKDDGTGPGGSSKTQTGVLMGTPVYMSPEQALAKRDIDHRADLYSAGVMLYELVAGRVPFDAESQAELLMEIVYRPNGLKAASEFNPTLPPEFDRIVTRSIAKDRDERFQEAADFVAALSPWIGDAPLPVESTGAHTIPTAAKTATLTPTTWEQGSKASGKPAESKRGVPMFAAGIAGGLIASAAIAFLVIGSRRAAPPVATTHSALAPAVSTASTLPARVAVDLAGLPNGALVEVDGLPAAGSHLEFQRGTTHSIRVVAAGRLPYVANLTADHDREIMIALADAPSVVAPAAPTPVPTASPTISHAVPHPATHPVTPPASPTPVVRHAAPAGPSHGNPLLPVSNEF